MITIIKEGLVGIGQRLSASLVSFKFDCCLVVIGQQTKTYKGEGAIYFNCRTQEFRVECILPISLLPLSTSLNFSCRWKLPHERKMGWA